MECLYLTVHRKEPIKGTCRIWKYCIFLRRGWSLGACDRYWSVVTDLLGTVTLVSQRLAYLEIRVCWDRSLDSMPHSPLSWWDCGYVLLSYQNKTVSSFSSVRKLLQYLTWIFEIKTDKCWERHFQSTIAYLNNCGKGVWLKYWHFWNAFDCFLPLHDRSHLLALSLHDAILSHSAPP